MLHGEDKKHSKFMRYMLLISFCGAAAALFCPILLSLWSDEGRSIGTKEIGILFVALLVATGLNILFTILRERYAKNYNIQNFNELAGKYVHSDYDYITEEGPANLLGRCQQAVDSIYMYMTGSAIQIWSSILILIVILVIMALQNPILALVMALMIPVNYFGYKLLNKELARRSEVLQKDCAEGFQILLSYLGQTDYLKQCGDYEKLFTQIHPALNRIYGSTASINEFAQSASTALSSVNNIAQTLIMATMAMDFVNQQSSPMAFVLLSVLFPVYFNNLSMVTNSNLSRQELEASKRFVREMEEHREPDGTKELTKVDAVTVDLPELKVADRVLAHDIKGEFSKGDIVWIRGESGRGKSTLAKLFLKMRPCDGIFYDGKNLADLTNESVRGVVDYFSQNVPIVNGTLRDNLFFNSAWSEEREKQLLQEPILKKLLEKHSLDEVIVENGGNLSGGEKQRVAFARSVYHQADVVIYDEVTSNIDKESTDEIMEYIVAHAADRITFIVSHDEDTRRYVTKTLEL